MKSLLSMSSHGDKKTPPLKTSKDQESGKKKFYEKWQYTLSVTMY
jgi:hypothetical protein